MKNQIEIYWRKRW